MKRYLLAWLTTTVALLLVVATVNLVVDPYGLFRWVDNPGFNSIKPAATDRGPMSKAYQVLRVQPQGLVLGNSRSEVGLDPNHPAWPAQARPVYNLALPGTGTSTSLHYLQHVLAASINRPASQPKVLVWGIDFMDFLTPPTVPGRVTGLSQEDMRLLLADNTMRWRQQTRDILESTLTLSAAIDSAQTLSSQTDPYAVDLTTQGFNPMRDYLKISAEEGYWNVFRQKDQANIRSFLRMPKGIFDASGKTSPHLEDLKEVMHLCRQHGIELHLFIYPYHAHLLEIFRVTGHWAAFETWKRTVVQTLSSEAENTGKPAFELWDFSAINAFTTEDVPAQGDLTSSMHWYWEAGHFKRELGSLMLDRILGHTAQLPDFGVLLTPITVESHIAKAQVDGSNYRRTHSLEVDQLESFARLVSQ